MIVNMGANTYEMTSKQFNKFLDTAKKCLKFGVYAIEKDGTAIMLNELPKNEKDLEEQIKKYTENGFKVYYNSKGI